MGFPFGLRNPIIGGDFGLHNPKRWGFFAKAKTGIPFRARYRSVLRTAASGPLQATLALRHPGAKSGCDFGLRNPI
jgi:hypothetical protein